MSSSSFLSSTSSRHEEHDMGADVQEVVKPFVENEEDVMEIMRLLSGLGASILIHSTDTVPTTVNTLEDLKKKIMLVRSKHVGKGVTVHRRSRDKQPRKLPIPSRGRKPIARAKGGGPLRKPDHTWRDGDPYVFHAPRVQGVREQLPVPTDPEIRDRYPWWWSALAPPDNDNATPPQRGRQTSPVSTRKDNDRASTLGTELHFSSSTLGSRTRAYLEEELSRPLSGVTDILDGSVSGGTYQTAEEGDGSMCCSGGVRGWRLEMDPMEFNEDKSSTRRPPLSESEEDVKTERDVESDDIQNIPAPSIPCSSPTLTSAPGSESSLMEIIDNWQQELRDLRRHTRPARPRVSPRPTTTVRSATKSNISAPSVSSFSSLSMDY